MVGMAVLVDHQSVITSPDDYVILGSRPVSSRTYFAVRLTNVLVYAWVITTLTGFLPTLSLGVRHGFHPLRAMAAVPALYLSATLAVFALILGYASLMRFIGARRLKRVMSYAQLVVSLLVNGAFLLPGQLIRIGEMSPTMPESPWIFLFPPTWFASYVVMADGSIGLRQALPAAVSIIALAACARGLGGRLSLDYASRLGAMISASERSSAAPERRPWLFKNGEYRVVSLLIRAQFRHDHKYRMAVLGTVPLALLYILLIFQSGPPADPFTSGVMAMFSWMPLTMAVLLFPVIVRGASMHSDAYRASWVYFGTPVDRARILQAQTDVLTVTLIAPYVCLVGAIMGYLSEHPIAAVTHIGFLGLGSRLLLQMATAVSPVLPFSRPAERVGQHPRMMMWLGVTVIAGLLYGPALVFFVYVNWTRIIVTGLALVVMSFALERLTRLRLSERAIRLQFEN
jgi:hypothetical protein